MHWGETYHIHTNCYYLKCLSMFIVTLQGSNFIFYEEKVFAQKLMIKVWCKSLNEVFLTENFRT